jgi:tetratricopeptide (TPR) repeat protein
MAMLSQKNKCTLNDQEKQEVRGLQSITWTNLAVCFHLEKNYPKAVDNARKSTELLASVKGFFRLGQSLKMMQDFDGACNAYKKAIQLDVSDPNDI